MLRPCVFPSPRAISALRAAAVYATMVAIMVFSVGVRSQKAPPEKSPPAHIQKGRTGAPRVSLAPKFTPGQTFRYEMEFETTTATSRSGIVSDPQGPSSLAVDWNATVRMEVLPTDRGTLGEVRLRTTYEKSTASVRSDSFDPAADETRTGYQKLQGKAIEFILDAGGKMKSVSGLEGLVDDEKAAQSARQWVDQFGASVGAPPGGVAPGQTWFSEQPANSLPLAGLVWHSDAEYLRDEPCYPPNPELPAAASAAQSAANAQAKEICAVILTKLNLTRPKPVRDPTPEEFRKNGVQTTGKWSGSGQSLMYVSLASGLVVSVTQTGTEEMDVTLTPSHNASIRYAGTITSRSHVALVMSESKEE